VIGYAHVVADSISPHEVRLTTMEVRFRRYVLAELNTHRAFSRNSASSRARSVKKTIQEVREDPAFPPVFPREQRGMSGGIEVEGKLAALKAWKEACDEAVLQAERLVTIGVHKSVVNRLLEPFMWHTAVITATDWSNFFSQRLALLEDETPAADPAMFELADDMKKALDRSTPEPVGFLEWHMPYVTSQERIDYDSLNCQRMSIARCAGVSYLSQGAPRTLERDLEIYARMRNASPPHWSPFEHVATPGDNHTQQYMNLRGWRSARWELDI
jgi:hypothetical protein